MMAFFVGVPQGHTSNEKPLLIPEDIMGAMVTVDGSSGTIVARTKNKAYILTAFHVVNMYYELNLKTKTMEPVEPIPVAAETYINDIRVIHMYDATGLDVDIREDLALIEIKVRNDSELNTHVKIATEDPRLGEDLFIIANPNGRNKTVLKGVLSNKRRNWYGTHSWQISGGLVYGASGGGAFNMNGELVAVAKAVDMISGSRTCLNVAKKEEADIDWCNVITPHMGFFASLDTVKKFLLKSKVKGIFKYLSEEK